MRILLAEDDTLLGDGLRAGLRQQGFLVDWVRDGPCAERELATDAYQAVVLDLGLPGKDGMEVLAAARKSGRKTPILVLTARDDIDARIKGLDSGADDYVVKPVDLFELGARLRSLIRRAHGHIDDQLVVEGVTLTVAARSVAFQGRAVSLSSREFDLLHALMSSAGRVLTRAQLEQRIYGWGQEVESNAVEYHIHNLRKKLSTELIETIRGVGYMIARRNPSQSIAAK